MNGAGKWKINVTKLYGDAMNLFFVAANMIEVVQKCIQASLPCTPLFNCGGDYER